jgi:flavin reductase (DIM6/NTAB) family NADH-FMN oxidoreductase RutF
MGKVTLGPQTLVYPMPAMLVGADVEGKPNFMAVAWGGIACGDPPMISVAIRHGRHTLKGIMQNETFSVNIPSVELVKETDYCGTVSGSKADKASVCRFEVFYGELGNAPLIGQCPVNLECKVAQILNLGSHSLVIGRIEETYVSEDCLTEGRPDVDKIRPLTYVTSPAAWYQGLGEVVGKAWSVGRGLA